MTSLSLGQYGKAKGLRFSSKYRMLEVNKFFIMWLFALFLQARHRPVELSENNTLELERASQSERVLYRLQTQAIGQYNENNLKRRPLFA